MTKRRPDNAGEPSAGIDNIVEQIRACTICRDTPATKPLPHQPRPVVRVSATARLAVCGQAPGTRVHASGIPFDDPSGDRLRAWMGVERNQFYDQNRIAVVPMGFCFPGLDGRGADLPPRKECVATWHDRLFAAIPQLELLLVVGQYAHAYHLAKRRRGNLTETVRAWRAIVNGGDPVKMLPLPHPSWRNTMWLKKNPWFEEEILPFLRQEVQRLAGDD